MKKIYITYLSCMHIFIFWSKIIVFSINVIINKNKLLKPTVDVEEYFNYYNYLVIF